VYAGIAGDLARKNQARFAWKYQVSDLVERG
jgi:hypothetical protein